MGGLPGHRRFSGVLGIASRMYGRTRRDSRVRPSHAENDGRVFEWNDPPATGHPGDDYGCRCTAEPYSP
ncbi:phage minor head protein [Cognatishimia sp. SS12]|uniref:phage minor head protein n=1 Tax=Cognatishimia sp. SS12 TaxID=2979465 RepID=UPI003FA452BD